MPKKVKKEWREFCCEDCEPRNKKYKVCRWFQKVSVSYPFAVCRECKEEKPAVPVEEGELIGVAKFVCKRALSLEQKCENEYTVICRGVDTALCYECEFENSPISVNPRSTINAKTDNKHSCSRCRHGKIRPCPNKARHYAK